MAAATRITSTADGSLEALEAIIKMALKRTGASKELDLCSYLSDERGALSPSTYLRLKDTDRETLFYLIKERILDTDLHKLHKAQGTHSPYAGQALEECIKEAMAKVNVLRETALCKYLPGEEGYLHHFTFLKMKSSNPIQLRNAIKEHILDHTPQLVQPKKRNRHHKSDGSEKSHPSKSRYENTWESSAEPRYTKVSEREESLEEAFDKRISSGLQKNIDDVRSSGGVKDAKIDQLIHVVSQLIEALQHRGPAVRVEPKGQAERKEYLGEKFFDKHLHLVQNQLIKKIRAGQADEALWGIFLELI